MVYFIHFALYFVLILNNQMFKPIKDRTCTVTKPAHQAFQYIYTSSAFSVLYIIHFEKHIYTCILSQFSMHSNCVKQDILSS